jgi:hypothetical protein
MLWPPPERAPINLTGLRLVNLHAFVAWILTLHLVCCAYECLRIVNYLSHSTIVDIQCLLVLGNVISNNMNAGVAWALLGTLFSVLNITPAC